MEITLYIDTSNKDMAVGLSKNDQLIYKKQYKAFRKQSEHAALEVSECLKQTNTKASDLTKIVVCIGPGSYTGIRIGLTLGKVMASVLSIELVTLSSLNTLAGIEKNVLTFIDARSNRVYVGLYNDGKPTADDQIMTLEDFNKIKKDYSLIGDLSLFGKEDSKVDIIQNMFLLAKEKQSVSNVDGVKAIYLKD